MEDLRQKKADEQRKKEIKKQKFYFFLKKNKWKIILGFIGISILIFPIYIGAFIGTFITDFLGTIIKNIHL